jgi:hypothetical protein
VNRVLFGEANGKRSFQGVQICEKGVYEGGRGGGAEEEGGFGVFGLEGGAFGEDSGCAGVFGFAVGELVRSEYGELIIGTNTSLNIVMGWGGAELNLGMAVRKLSRP